MRLSKSALYSAAAVVTVLISFKALSEGSSATGASALVDAAAFDSQWSGDYYVEPEETEGRVFRSSEERRDYFLNSPEIGTVNADADGNPVELPPSDSTLNPIDPSPLPSPSVRPWFAPLRSPWENGAVSPFSIFRISPTPSPTPSGTPAPGPSSIPSGKAQAFYYYNRGLLQNGTEIESDGKGFVKVFRDRDEAMGGRGWGTRTLIGLIRQMASDFADRFPGRERLQIADIARKSGGKMAHGSHQNGLDADIVYVRKNRKEQAPFGGYGKNGFAEQFIVRTLVPKRVKTAGGTTKIAKVPVYVPSANFDTEANFELLRMFHRTGEVKTFFMDDVLVREMYRYAKAKGIDGDPEVEAMLEKLDPQPSHADHFHVRLYCQDGDPKCFSENAPARQHTTPKRHAAK